ncbi:MULTISPECIES: copper resistance CopC family protein [Corynebacterium]|uniref:Copper resistance protein CopC n=1 Tax=Corynebacterium macclintockiae TaxID=2913501 RepID=A0A9X3M573_9CORY|nr:MULTISPECIES: copper resistance protein CopC [Corynebacterium]MBC6795719.1 hypothetical protein [Corynebacterium sp. LK28]MCZ9304406.1 copper resistance protein CopC [Corynebacterium macclintockiae]
MPRRFSSFGRPLARGLAACGMVAAVSVGVSAPAEAHDVVLNSNPSANSTVDHLPGKIVLDFSGAPQDGFNNIALSHNGDVLFRGEPKADGRQLSIDVPEDVQSKKDNGEYVIGYQITSSDGHSTRGSVKFTLEAEGGTVNGAGDSGEEKKSEEGEAGEQSPSVPSWLLPLGGIVVIVGALALAIARFRDVKND